MSIELLLEVCTAKCVDVVFDDDCLIIGWKKIRLYFYALCAWYKCRRFTIGEFMSNVNNGDVFISSIEKNLGCVVCYSLDVIQG